MRGKRLFLTLGFSLASSGCGLFIQGTRQRVLIETSPPGALVSLLPGGNGSISPAEVSVRRRAAWVVIRAQKSDYHSACRLVEAANNKSIVVLDSVPLAVPLLIDKIAGALYWYPDRVELTLRPLPSGWTDVLPDSDAILTLWEKQRINLCDPAPPLREMLDFRSRYAKRASMILVSAGDISRPYEILGRVDQQASGQDYWVGYALYVWTQSLGFGQSRITHYEYKADPVVMNEMLQFQAIRQFGETVDAIINVHYETMPGNDVSAGGLAVRFTGPSS